MVTARHTSGEDPGAGEGPVARHAPARLPPDPSPLGRAATLAAAGAGAACAAVVLLGSVAVAHRLEWTGRVSGDGVQETGLLVAAAWAATAWLGAWLVARAGQRLTPLPASQAPRRLALGPAKAGAQALFLPQVNTPGGRASWALQCGGVALGALPGLAFLFGGGLLGQGAWRLAQPSTWPWVAWGVLALLVGAAPALACALLQRLAEGAFHRIELRLPLTPRAPGQPPPCVVHARARRPLRLAGVQLTVVVRRTTAVEGSRRGVATIRLVDDFRPVARQRIEVGQALEAGGVVEVFPSLEVEPGAPRPQPHLPRTPGDPPAIEWYLVVDFDVARWPDARAVFALCPGDEGVALLAQDTSAAARAPREAAPLDLVSPGVEVLALDPPGRDRACPYCGDPLSGAVVACATCETLHHPECWSEVGRCTRYACEGQARVAALSLS